MTNKPPKNDWRDWLANLLGLTPEDRDALVQLLKKIKRKGGVSPDEMAMIEGVLGMRALKVRDVMLPMSEVVCMKITDDYQQAVDRVNEWEHSRYPVVDVEGGSVLGILLAKELLKFVNTPGDFRMRPAMRDAVEVPDGQSLGALLDDFKDKHDHMVIVRDEYTQLAGVVTIEDVLEKIVGDIADETDDEGEIIDGHTTLDAFNKQFGSALSAGGAATIAGWLAAKAGRILKADEEYEEEGFRFEVTAADSKRVRRLTVYDNRDDTKK